MQTSPTFDWPGVGRRNEEATKKAKAEAHQLARALAAHSIVVERDAVVEEFDERVAAIEASVWPHDALHGYKLHSSLGAYFVARVAVGLVPSGSYALRHEPLRRDGLFVGLTEHGVQEATALSVLGEWKGVPSGFRGDRDGIDTSILAGLAERTLSRAERDAALSQVAVSPRCLLRLASTCALVDAARAIMVVLPPEDLGPEFTSAAAALSLSRPDRVVELFGDRAESLGLKTLTELAAAQWALGRSEPAILDEDGLILRPPMDRRASGDAWGEETDTGIEEEIDIDDEQSDEDVLEIVEERVDPSYLPEPPSLEELVPRPPRWTEEAAAIPETLLREWNEARRRAHERLGREGWILGFDVRSRSATAMPMPIPPDERTLTYALEASVFDPLFPPVRGMLRAIMAAAEGDGPTLHAIDNAGDLTWATRRARALAMIVRGDLTSAIAAVEAMPREAAPEGKWARDRLFRFQGRQQIPVTSEEARPAAAALVADLAAQLTRTIAGTLPHDIASSRRG
jgi:hypothetical protein